MDNIDRVTLKIVVDNVLEKKDVIVERTLFYQNCEDEQGEFAGERGSLEKFLNIRYVS